MFTCGNALRRGILSLIKTHLKTDGNGFEKLFTPHTTTFGRGFLKDKSEVLLKSWSKSSLSHATGVSDSSAFGISMTLSSRNLESKVDGTWKRHFTNLSEKSNEPFEEGKSVSSKVLGKTFFASELSRVNESSETALNVPQDPAKSSTEYYIPLNALYISRSLDLKGLLGGPFKSFRSHFVRNHAVVRFPDRSHGIDPSPREKKVETGGPSGENERYVVVFQYGSVVFLNFELEEQEVVLDMMLPFCSERFPEVRKDDYGVVVCPTLPVWSDGGQDHVIVKRLDLNSIRVISSVLGQSVALDFYAKTVDDMVNTFSDLNRGMENTGTFTMKRKELFQLVAAANTTLADVILRLGLLEKSDTAWKYAQYAKIWEFVRYDFELEQRFESLDFKLNIIQHNVRFFLEILQNRKSDTLEWIIILLIAGEICVSLYEIVTKAVENAA